MPEKPPPLSHFVLLHPEVWGGPWNTIIPVFWISLYAFGFVVAGRWAARQDGDLFGTLAVAVLWPLVALFFGSVALLTLLFTPAGGRR